MQNLDDIYPICIELSSLPDRLSIPSDMVLIYHILLLAISHLLNGQSFLMKVGTSADGSVVFY